ncbi:TMAO reductase system periplasmic protein TorT [Zoogloea sp. LCSB751]|uniref:TMAO reductase system periplasmic protein TorT n=1 Tax=Zoogloea sp. LCSB751 TaxID=1965277 RepID=UPI0009A4CCD6|nr:TMAO reductase system periplasmic protein TorT [Zoogloea sp. LCSB751]
MPLPQASRLLTSALFLGVSTCLTAAAPTSPVLPAAVKFDPIPVHVIQRPLPPGLTADAALRSGRVSTGNYAMTARASRPWRIAFLFPHIKDPYWIGCSYGVISEARRLGVAVDILPADGYKDLIGQLRQMEEASNGRYDAIVLSPISLDGNNPSITRARAKGIPVFELANDSTSDDLTIKITTSLRSMGLDATRWVIRDAQKRGLSAINIALLPGPAGAGWVKGEVEGSQEAARKAPIRVNIVDIRYGDSDRIEQSQLAAQLLAKHGHKLDYIIGCTGCAPAARLPIHEAGLDDRIRIVAYDLTREIAGLIRRQEIFAAADTKALSQARVTLNAVVNHLEGRVKTPPHTLLVKLGIVDQNNLDTYRLDESIAPDGYTPILSYDPKREHP